MADSSQRSRRVPISLKINLKLADKNAFVERFAQNISRTGIFIRAKEPLAVGSPVSFEYRLANDQRLIRGAGIVRWARRESEATEREPPGMGIEFTDVDPTTDALIAEIVAKHGEGLRAPKREMKRVGNETPGPAIDLSEENLLDDQPPRRPPLGPTPSAGRPASAPAPIPPPAAPPPATPMPAAPLPSLSARPASVAADNVAIVDLAGDVLRWTGKSGDEERAQPWRLAADGAALHAEGTPVPSPLRLFDLGRAACTVLLRHAGLPFAGLGEDGPRLEVGGRVMSAAELLRLALTPIAAAGAKELRLVVPTGCGPRALAALRAAAAALGLPVPAHRESAALLVGANTPPLPRPALVLEVGALEASAALVDTGVSGTDLAVDAGWGAVDAAIAREARQRFAKDHGIDVDDDPELAAALHAQVESAKQRAAGTALHLTVAGAVVDIPPEEVAALLRPQSERLLLLCEHLMTHCSRNMEDTRSLLLYTEAPPWPGLEAALRDWAPQLAITVQSSGGARLRAWGLGV